MTQGELKKEALQFLDGQITAVVATVSAKGEPQAATMYYYTDNDFNFYFMAARDSKKLENLEANRNVAIVVGFGPTPITIQAGGVVDINHEFKEEFIDKILKKISLNKLDHWPVLQLEKKGLVMLKVEPKWLTFLNFDKEGHPKTYSNQIHQLI